MLVIGYFGDYERKVDLMKQENETKLETKRIPFQFGDANIVLGADREKHGLVSYRKQGIGFDLVREPYFALNLYRIMNGGCLSGIARTEPFRIESESANKLVLHWEPTPTNPCRMEAVYEIIDAATIDLTISIEAASPLSKHELSISSYFDFTLEPYAVLPSWPAKTGDGDMVLHKVEDHPLIRGHYVFLPRDNEAGHTLLDGRWINEKTGKPIAHFVTGPFYGRPIAIMSNEDVHVVQMADPSECSAVGITYSSLNEEDSIRKHNALYFTLFGSDLQQGERRTAVMRQVVLSGKPTLERTLELYDQFMSSR